MVRVKKKRRNDTIDRRQQSPDRKAGHATFNRLLTSPIYRERQTLWNAGFLAILLMALLLPFAGKAFNMDDPLFIWTARQILDHPADFFGFQVNWYGHEQPMYEVMKNPPLTAYFIALVAFLFGFGEVPLHIAFLSIAVAAAVGIYFLARELCPSPLLATLAGVLTPAFLVSSNTIMCDIPMLACWIWAVVFWIHGLKEDRILYYFIASVLICLSMLNKYFGLSLVPLLFAYSWADRRSMGRWAFFLLIPLAVTGFYELLTGMMYGRGLFSDAIFYPILRRPDDDVRFISQGVISLAFMGGGFLTAFFLVPYLCSWRVFTAGLALTAGIFLVLSALPNIGDFPLRDGIRAGVVFQLSVFAVTGLIIIAVAATDLIKSKDSGSLLLFLWILGTFLFAAFVNWTTNIRAILPVAPAVGILIMRRICGGETEPLLKSKTPLPFLLFAGALLAFFTVWADASLANTVRSAASEIAKKYGDGGRPLWFQGHWGFQYYMQNEGGKPIDYTRTALEKGARIVIPLNNANLKTMPRETFEFTGNVDQDPVRWLTTMSLGSGAGFYSKTSGPIPFVLGVGSPERYVIVTMTAPLQYSSQPQ
jgi:4-amino-4-deoxy-L-arabinose transferase-like glycosyltransferase